MEVGWIGFSRWFHGFGLVSIVFHGGYMVFHGFWLVSIVFQVSFMVSDGFLETVWKGAKNLGAKGIKRV